MIKREIEFNLENDQRKRRKMSSYKTKTFVDSMIGLPLELDIKEEKQNFI